MKNVNIGILRAPQIDFCLSGGYSLDGIVLPDGDYSAAVEDGAIMWQGALRENLSFVPLGEGSQFTLYGVVIGVNFHWERKQNQTFAGALRFVVEDGELRAINNLPVEKYLESVISSEMSATSSLEFLKAHTVSRAVGYMHSCDVVRKQPRLSWDTRMMNVLSAGMPAKIIRCSTFVPTTIVSAIRVLHRSAAKRLPRRWLPPRILCLYMMVRRWKHLLVSNAGAKKRLHFPYVTMAWCAMHVR